MLHIFKQIYQTSSEWLHNDDNLLTSKGTSFICTTQIK